jgi:omega-amidase
MRVCAVQLDIVWQDPEVNCRRVSDVLAAGSIPEGSLVVLPETFAVGFDAHNGMAESRGGPTEQYLAGLARRHASYVVGGTLTGEPGATSRNEALAFGPDGGLLARYAKIHPFSFAGESLYREAGNEIAVIACGKFLMAPLVCYDLRFPETFRAAVARGANLYAVIANWPEPRADHWTSLLKARAIENQAYVIGVNRTGRDEKNVYAGGSVVFGPKGETVAVAGRDECVVEAELDSDALEEYRASFPALKDMR